ncbi:MAG: hypothetical protein R3E46_04210 [Sedimenticolaceae bacterium]
MQIFDPTDRPALSEGQIAFVLHPAKSSPIGLVARLPYLDSMAEQLSESLDAHAAKHGCPSGGHYALNAVSAALQVSDPASYESTVVFAYWALFAVDDFADATDQLLKHDTSACVVHVSLDIEGTPRVRVEVPDPATTPLRADRAAHQTVLH